MHSPFQILFLLHHESTFFPARFPVKYSPGYREQFQARHFLLFAEIPIHHDRMQFSSDPRLSKSGLTNKAQILFSYEICYGKTNNFPIRSQTQPLPRSSSILHNLHLLPVRDPINIFSLTECRTMYFGISFIRAF